jgi:hypothetical protein
MCINARAETYVKDEEGEMFPDARKFLGEKRLIGTGNGVGGAPVDKQTATQAGK